MALTTRLDEFRLSYGDSFVDLHEHRMGNFGGVAVFQKDSKNTIPGLQKLIDGAKFTDRTASVPVVSRVAWSADTARTCSAETNANTSAWSSLSWSTFHLGFRMVPSEYDYDFVAYQDAFNLNLKSVARIALETVDGAIYTKLNTDKAAYDPTSGFPYAFTGNEYIVPVSEYSDGFNQMLATIMDNKINTNRLNVIASPRVSSLVNRLVNQGSANANNTQFQFGPYNFNYSNNMTVAADMMGSCFIMPESTVALVTHVSPDAQRGHKSGDGKEWRKIFIPELGFEVEVLYQSTCLDYSGTITSLKNTLSESFSIAFDYALVSSYASAPSSQARPIWKVSFSKS